jgi:hypothetical protein
MGILSWPGYLPLSFLMARLTRAALWQSAITFCKAMERAWKPPRAGLISSGPESQVFLLLNGCTPWVVINPLLSSSMASGAKMYESAPCVPNQAFNTDSLLRGIFAPLQTTSPASRLRSTG